MTIIEMFNELKDKARDTFIVTLKYKYDFEENYTIENHILEYDSKDDGYVWLNDWSEGQTDIEVLGYMPLGDVDTTKLESCEMQSALDMAIKALERQEKILSYIDRLLNQGTGKKKSLEFLKKYILEGEKNDE